MQSAMVVIDMICGGGVDSTGDHFGEACNDSSAQSTSRNQCNVEISGKVLDPRRDR